MQNYKNLVLQNEIGNLQMLEPIQDGTSKIDKYPLDVVEKLGKYQFIYDYEFGGLQVMCIKAPCGGINPTRISKGDVVNVIRFEGNNAIIENPNYKELAPDAPKISFWASLGDTTKQKEFSIPKDYLQKVDDNSSITMQLGNNFGANPKPQPISIKPIGIGSEPSSDVILEENATFSLVKPFTYVTSYTKGRPLYELGGAGMLQYVQTPNYETIPAGTKVTGRLFKSIANQKVISAISGVSNSMIRPTVIEKDFLAVKGYGNTGSINIPIEYLTREVSTNTNNNNGNVVPVANDNKNLLMIVGAFLVGYVLFSKETPST
jgi:hypothetical protein